MDSLSFMNQNGFHSYDYSNTLLSRLIRVCYPHELPVPMWVSQQKKTVEQHGARPVISNFCNSAGYVEIR